FYLKTLFTLSIAKSNSSLEMISGGANLITVSWVSLHNKPASFSFSQYGLAFSFNSIPINNPRPRTSLIDGCSIFSNSDLKYSPNSNERPAKSSSTKTSNAAIDTAQAKGFPPNVEP